MADNDLSISGISANILQNTAQKFEVAVTKKAIDAQGEVAKQLIEAAASTDLPDGIGRRINTVA